MARETGGNLRKRLAAAVRLRREELGWTQEEAAEHSGLSVRYWRELESARPAVGLEVVERILTGLGWSWQDLAAQLGGTALPRRKGDAPRGLHALLDRAWRGATARERRLVEVVLAVLAPHRGPQ
jgi:transcriptional regulator with XRE-family HTH domain